MLVMIVKKIKTTLSFKGRVHGDMMRVTVAETLRLV